MSLTMSLLLFLTSTALAVPTSLGTQGRLLDGAGVPVEDTLVVTFRILDADSGGNTLWEESQTVAFANGFYSVLLGADEATDPLSDQVLDQWPLWLEVQIDGQPAMVPRTSLDSVPYARLAGTSESVVGGEVDVSSIRISGTEVVDSSGAWVGPAPVVDWSELTGVPGDFADGDDADSLGDLRCGDGQWPLWDASSSSWMCDAFADTTLLEREVEDFVTNDALDLYAGTTLDSEAILTPSSTLDPGALDTSAGAEGQLLTLSSGTASWQDAAAPGACTLSSRSGGQVVLDCGGTSLELQTASSWVDVGAGYYGMAAIDSAGRLKVRAETTNRYDDVVAGGTPAEVDLSFAFVGVHYDDGTVEIIATNSGYDSVATTLNSAFSGTWQQLEVARRNVCVRDSAGMLVCSNNAGTLTTRASSGAVDVAAYDDHGCMVDGSANVQCWGTDSYGETTSQTGSFAKVGTGEKNTCAITTSGSLTCWGYAGYGLNSPPSGTNFVEVDVGNTHACALDSSGIAWCWGHSNYGRDNPPQVALATLAVGQQGTCGITLNSGEIVCWGRMDEGLLDL